MPTPSVFQTPEIDQNILAQLNAFQAANNSAFVPSAETAALLSPDTGNYNPIFDAIGKFGLGLSRQAAEKEVAAQAAAQLEAKANLEAQASAAKIKADKAAAEQKQENFKTEQANTIKVAEIKANAKVDAAAAKAKHTASKGGKPKPLTAKLTKDIIDNGASVTSLVETGFSVIDSITSNPSSVTSTGSVQDGLFSRLTEELKGIVGGEELGVLDKMIDSTIASSDKAGDFDPTVRSKLKSIVYQMASAYGQSGRSMSDKDLKMFTRIIVGDWGDSNAIARNLHSQLGSVVRGHRRRLNDYADLWPESMNVTRNQFNRGLEPYNERLTNPFVSNLSDSTTNGGSSVRSAADRIISGMVNG